MFLHELLLRGEVPFERHDQVLRILAGVAAHQPVRVFQRFILYEPVRDAEEPGSNIRRGGTQNVAVKQQSKQGAAPALYYTKLIQELSEDDFGAQKGGSSLSADVADDEDTQWSMRWEDVPDTGDRGVSVIATNTTELRSGDPHAFMLAEGPNRYVILRSRVFHIANIVIGS
jgi:mediator of RNA polymerase II transcription subunit 18